MLCAADIDGEVEGKDKDGDEEHSEPIAHLVLWVQVCGGHHGDEDAHDRDEEGFDKERDGVATDGYLQLAPAACMRKRRAGAA